MNIDAAIADLDAKGINTVVPAVVKLPCLSSLGCADGHHNGA